MMEVKLQHKLDWEMLIQILKIRVKMEHY